MSREVLQCAWQSMAPLVDKAMKSHSKCDFCAYIDSQLKALVGRTDEWACQQHQWCRWPCTILR